MYMDTASPTVDQTSRYPATFGAAARGARAPAYARSSTAANQTTPPSATGTPSTLPYRLW